MSDSVLAWSPEGQYSPVGAINMQSPGGCHAHDLECCHLRGITMILSITFLLLFHFRASQTAKSHRCSCMAALFVAKWRHTWS